MRVIGLDLSLTCTGIADELGARTFKPKSTGMERLGWVRHHVLSAVRSPEMASGGDAGPLMAEPGWTMWTPVAGQDGRRLVVIEGYSMGTARQSSHAHGLGELGGVVRLALWESGIPYVDVAPASLKKYATGAGNAKKDAVLGSAIRRLGYEGDDHNEADALWLRAMAMDHYGAPVVTVPAVNRSALAAVKWPVLDVAAVA